MPPRIYEDQIYGFKFYGNRKQWTSILFNEGKTSVNFPTDLFITDIMLQLRKKGIIESTTIHELEELNPF